MIYSNLTHPSRTKIGKFTVIASFAEHIEQLSRENILLVGDTAGVSFDIHGKHCCFSLAFCLPSETKGTFTVALLGRVHLPFKVMPVEVQTQTVEVNFNTNTTIPCAFGEVENTSGGRVIVPIRFDEPVVNLSKTHFQVQSDSGHVRSQLYGDGADYRLYLHPRRGGTGRLVISCGHQVVETETGIRLRPEATPITVTL